MNWDQYFDSIVETVRQKSPDTSSKYGAVVADRNHRILATGYNGLPRGIRHREEYHQRPDKYMYFVHAEQNAVFNAAAVGTPILGALMYVLQPPCVECVKAIVQTGIAEVVYRERLDPLANSSLIASDSHTLDNWRMNMEAAYSMLQEANVLLRVGQLT
jgi:dCMP deaminase